MPLFGPVNINKLYGQGNIKKLLKVLQKSKNENQGVEVREALRKLGADAEKSQERISTWLPFKYDALFKMFSKLDSTEKQQIAVLIQKLEEEKQNVDRKEKAKVELREKIKARFDKAFPFYYARDTFYDELGSILSKDRKFSFKVKLSGAQALHPDGIIVTKYHFIYFSLPYHIMPIPIEDIADAKITTFGKLIITRKDGSTYKVEVQTKCKDVVAHLKQTITINDYQLNCPEVKET